MEPFRVLYDGENEAEWRGLRGRGLGASDLPIILGLVPFSWGTPVSLWAEKLGLADGPVETERMRLGKILEPAIVEALLQDPDFRDEYPGEWTAIRDQRLLASTENPFVRCTLDYRIRRASDGREIVVECKRSGMFDVLDDGLPARVEAQTQQQMYVTGAELVLVAFLVPDGFWWFEVPRNEVFIREVMLPALETFWSFVEREEVPPIDGADETRKALATVWPSHEPGRVEKLSFEFLELFGEVEEIDAEIARLDERKREIENRVRLELREAERGVLPDGSAWTYKTTKAGVRVLRRRAART